MKAKPEHHVMGVRYAMSRHIKGDLSSRCKGHEIFALRNRWLLVNKVSCSGLILQSTLRSVRTLLCDLVYWVCLFGQNRQMQQSHLMQQLYALRNHSAQPFSLARGTNFCSQIISFSKFA